MEFIIYFLIAAFFMNALPHFINGLSGRPFPSPFASPPGIGKSSALSNIIWACINFGVSGLLITQTQYSLELNEAKLTGLIVGATSTAFILAWWFGKIHERRDTV